MEKPSITLITPSYNQGQFIRETIESVLSQNYPYLEYWIIDGGSTDQTLSILEEYKGCLNYITEPDEGQSDAIQKGFDRAQGDIVGWLNSDDVLKPLCLHRVATEFLKSKEVGLVYGDIEIVDEKRRHITYFMPGILSADSLLHKSQSVPQPGSFYKKCKVDELKGIDRDLKFVMDYDLFIRLLKVTTGVYIPSVLAEFRLHNMSKSTEFNNTLMVIEAFRVSRRYTNRIATQANWIRLTMLIKGFTKKVLGLPSIDIEKLISRSGKIS